MIFATKNGVSAYQFENLAACSGVDHRIFTRNSGKSRPPFASLNVGHGIGDISQNVTENRGIVSRFMAAGRLIFAHQVHGCEIAVLSRDREKKGLVPADRTLTADAMVTDIHGRTLDFTHGATLAANRGVLATNRLLHESVLSHVQQVVDRE